MSIQASCRLASASGPFSANGLLGTSPYDNRMDYVNLSYDAPGNPLLRQHGVYGSCTGEWCAAQTVAYAYSGLYDQLTSTSAPKAESFAYNGLGSMTSRSNWAYVYDFQQELVQAKSTSPAYMYTYSYDGTGREVKEVDATVATCRMRLSSASMPVTRRNCSLPGEGGRDLWSYPNRGLRGTTV